MLLGGMVAGRFAHETGLGSFVAQAALVPVLARTHGARGAFAAACVVAPMWAKRLAGNRPPDDPTVRAYASRLLFDRDVGAHANDEP
jgi:hypothetical protein